MADPWNVMVSLTTYHLNAILMNVERLKDIMQHSSMLLCRFEKKSFLQHFLLETLMKLNGGRNKSKEIGKLLRILALNMIEHILVCLGCYNKMP